MTSDLGPRMRFCCALVLALSACGGKEEPAPLLWVSRGGANAPASVASNVFVVDAIVNGTAKSPVIIDTGAPISLLDVGAFNGEIPRGVGHASTLTVGGVTLSHVPTVGVQSSVPGGIGLLGFTAFGQFAMGFDYRDRRVSFGDGAAVRSVASPVSIAFSREGGGLGTLPGAGILVIPRSRINVLVVIEGEGHPFMLDTGASEMAIRQSIFDSITVDGRGMVSDQVALVGGLSASKFTRLRSVVCGGLEVTGAPGVSGYDIDDLLDSAAAEMGHPIDGLLGGSYLREFHVTIDYPENRLVLRRYATRDHIQDEFQRVGIELSSAGSTPPLEYTVSVVFPGTDAERQGIAKGDVVQSIDGNDLSDEDPLAVDRLLLGQVGSTHTLDLDRGPITVLVEDILPLP